MTIDIKGSLKKILLSCLIVIVVCVSLVPPKPANAFVFALPAAIPAGALAFWGGAILVATAGAAIGLNPDLMDEVAAFGEATYNKATQATKDMINWATSKMTLSSPTEYEYKTYAIEFPAPVQAYLKAEFKEWFVDGPEAPKLQVNPTTNLLEYWTPGSYRNVGSRPNHALGQALVDIGDVFAGWQIRSIEYRTANTYFLYYQRGAAEPTYNTYITVSGYNGSASDVFRHLVDTGKIALTVNAAQGWTLETEPIFSVPVSAPADVVVPGDIPVGWPDVITMPAPVGVVNPTADVVDMAFPAIGYPNGVRTADPLDVAIGNPAIPGQAVTELSPDQAITKPADVPVPTTANPPVASPWTPTMPNVDWPDKLRAAVTTRFPFSLPWDVSYIVNLFVAPPQVPVIAVNTSLIKFSVTLNQLDPYMPWFRAFIIAGFLWGLVLNTRRLLGGGQ